MNSNISQASQCLSQPEPLFSYSSVPLPSAKIYIRLLTLLPSDPTSNTASNQDHLDAPLKCRITCVPLDSPPAYQAMSYAWGCDTKDHHLLLDTKIQGNSNFTHVPITASLDVALRHLRQPAGTATLWIDQVCINQEDVLEKNAQVGVMGDVYTNASEVLIWLGRDDNDSSIGGFMGKMEDGARLARVAGLDTLFSRNIRDESFWNFMNTVTSTNPNGPPAEEPAANLIREAAQTFVATSEDKLKIAAQLCAWFSRPWFGRAWVLQEYVLAKNAIFVCGYSRIDTQTFELGHMLLCIMCTGQQGTDAPNPKDADALLTLGAAVSHDPLAVLAKMQRQYRQSTSARYPLFRLLRDVYRLGQPPVQSKYQRDRIFALLGLAGDVGDLGILPDYSPSLTTDILYARVTQAILALGGGDLSPLELVRFPKTIIGEDHLAVKLPSWVPDFHCPQESVSLPTKEDDGKRFYNPTGKLQKPQVSFPREGVICIKGVLVDEIETVGQPWLGGYDGGDNEPGVHHNHDIRKCCDYFRQVARLCSLSKKKLVRDENTDFSDPIYKTRQRRKEASYRTMLGDIAWGASCHPARASPALLKVLKDLLKAGKLIRKMAELVAGLGDGTQHADQVSEVTAQVSENSRKATSLLTLDVGALARRLEQMRNKAPFLTRVGYVGMGPLQTQEGDVLVLLYGARTPYVVRPCGSGGEREFELVGEAYCDGVMDEELADRPGEEFCLV